MGFFENLGENVEKFGNEAFSTAKDAVCDVKSRVKAYDLQLDLNKIYSKIGKAYVDNGKQDSEEIDALILKAEELEKRIEAVRKDGEK